MRVLRLRNEERGEGNVLAPPKGVTGDAHEDVLAVSEEAVAMVPEADPIAADEPVAADGNGWKLLERLVGLEGLEPSTNRL